MQTYLVIAYFDGVIHVIRLPYVSECTVRQESRITFEKCLLQLIVLFWPTLVTRKNPWRDQLRP